jgi:uncharacterized protein DUF4158
VRRLESIGLLEPRIWRGFPGCLRRNGRFPDDEADPAPAVVRNLAAEIGVGVEVLENYEWTRRTGRHHRRLVLDRLAVTSFDEWAEARLRTCLSPQDDVGSARSVADSSLISSPKARGGTVRPSSSPSLGNSLPRSARQLWPAVSEGYRRGGGAENTEKLASMPGKQIRVSTYGSRLRPLRFRAGPGFTPLGSGWRRLIENR